MAAIPRRRNPLWAWLIGLVIIAIADTYAWYFLYLTKCEATGLSQFLVLVIMPVVYLGLMYLTLKSKN